MQALLGTLWMESYWRCYLVGKRNVLWTKQANDSHSSPRPIKLTPFNDHRNDHRRNTPSRKHHCVNDWSQTVQTTNLIPIIIRLRCNQTNKKAKLIVIRISKTNIIDRKQKHIYRWNPRATQNRRPQLNRSQVQPYKIKSQGSQTSDLHSLFDHSSQ